MCFRHNPWPCLWSRKSERRGFKEFSSVFPFGAWLLPKSQWFNQQQAKLASVGRLWSYAGLVVWFRAMWTMECRKEPFILTLIPFICVTQACPICFFKGKLKAGACCVSFCVCCTVSNYNTAKGTGSLFCFDNNTDLVTTPLSLFAFLHWGLFICFIIKSYRSPPPLIHLRLSHNHCHAVPLFCSPNWCDFGSRLWSVPSVLWPTLLQTMTAM